VNRRYILVALLAMLLAACGSQGSSEADATLTPEPPEATPEATPEAPESTEPVESEDDGGTTGSLDDMIPDDLNGVAGTPIPGLEQILGPALAQQGLNADDVEIAFVTYGDGADAVVLQAFRIPGVSDQVMEQLAQVMSGAGPQQGVDVEPIEVGGKSVLSFSGGQTPGVVYFYVADDVAFTVAGESEGLVEQLLSELP
jgi:hypothetical protein